MFYKHFFNGRAKINFKKRRGILDSKICAEFFSGFAEAIVYLSRICTMCKFTTKFFKYIFWGLSCLNATLNNMFKYSIEKKAALFWRSIEVYCF